MSIFDLDTFQRSGLWLSPTNKSFSSLNFIDTYENEYPDAHIAFHKSQTKDDNSSPIYLLDYKYKVCQGKFAWPKADKNKSGEIWIEFYSGDTLIYKTDSICATDRAVSFEFSAEGIETLTIVRNGTQKRSVIHAIYPYLDLVQ